MYSNGEGLGTPAHRALRPERRGHRNGGESKFSARKSLVSCICPRCRKVFEVFMLWTGRGIPRKYCVDCKAIIRTYDETALLEYCLEAPNTNKNKGRYVSEE